jgi:nitrogen fixation NifU-like protein
MDLYRDIILDHYKHPRNFGTLPKPDKTAESYNATCGDRIRFDVILDANQKVKRVSFSGVGCAVSQATASMLTEELIGMSVAEIMQIKAGHMIELVGSTLTPSRVKCATLPLEVIQKALVE